MFRFLSSFFQLILPLASTSLPKKWEGWPYIKVHSFIQFHDAKMVMSLTDREIFFFLIPDGIYTQLFQISNYMSFIIVSKKIWEIFIYCWKHLNLEFPRGKKKNGKMNNVENHASLIFHWIHSTPTALHLSRKVKVSPGRWKYGHLNLHFFLGSVEGNAV